MSNVDDFGLWIKTRYLLKNLDEDTLRGRQDEILNVLGGLKRILSMFVDSLPRPTLLALCNLLYAPQTDLDVDIQTMQPLAPCDAYYVDQAAPQSMLLQSQTQTQTQTQPMSISHPHSQSMSTATTHHSLQSLPEEMLHLVCNYLNMIDLANLQQTCCELAIVSRQQISIKPALAELNNVHNNEALTCSMGFKQEILSLLKNDNDNNNNNMNTQFLQLSALIACNMERAELLIKHGIIGKLVEFIKYDDKKCNFKYKYGAMKILIDLVSVSKETEQTNGNSYKLYLQEICEGYGVLAAFHALCHSEPVSKLLHYASSCDISEDKNDRIIMETDRDIIRAFRWDKDAKRWRECGDGAGRICVSQNIQSGMHKFMLLNADDNQMRLLQYIDNQQDVRFNRNDCSVYWHGDDYVMHTNGIWKIKFDVFGNNGTNNRNEDAVRMQAIQIYDCFHTYSHKSYQSVGAKIMQQLDSDNIFDHFYWLTSPLQQHILHILRSDCVPHLNLEALKQLLQSIEHLKKYQNRKDEIQHIIGCGVLHKIVKFVTPYYHDRLQMQMVSYSIKILLSLLNIYNEEEDDSVDHDALDHHGNKKHTVSSPPMSPSPALMITNEHIMDEYDVIPLFYKILVHVHEDSEILQDVLDCFAVLTLIPERRHEAIKVGVLHYIFSNVLEYNNAIVQSVCVFTISRFFANFTSSDFAMMDESTIQMIPSVLMHLSEKAIDYDDYEMQKQVLCIMEAFCDGSNSEHRSRIIVHSGCLRYIANFLNECTKYTSPKNQCNTFNIESSCIRIIGNVLCDSIWSDFEDKTVHCLEALHYLPVVHALFHHAKLSRDILWSLSNILISGKGISWIVQHEQIIHDLVSIATSTSSAAHNEQHHNHESNNNNENKAKLANDAAWSLCTAFAHCTRAQKLVFVRCGFVDVLTNLIGIHRLNARKRNTVQTCMEHIVKANITGSSIRKSAERQLQEMAQRQSDSIFVENLDKILEMLQPRQS